MKSGKSGGVSACPKKEMTFERFAPKMRVFTVAFPCVMRAVLVCEARGKGERTRRRLKTFFNFEKEEDKRRRRRREANWK